MNYPMIAQILGRMISVEAGLMLLPTAVCLIYGESPMPFLPVIALAAVAGGLLWRIKPKNKELYAREGFAIVALSWIVLSLIGAVPFVLSGDIPSYVDAVFETVSGFTTTGSTILRNVEALGRGTQFWRCFTHWVGGMGVLVFMMAVLPMSGEYSMHIMRAEMPGPVVGKLVPRARKTAAILYRIYVAMTLLETVLLLFGGMSLYDALLHSFGTAGTGGFSNQAASIGAYNSVYIEMVIAVFMALFGVNFNLYYFLLIGRPGELFKNKELLLYVGIIAFATLTMAANAAATVGSFTQSLRYSFFTVSSLITTTGFGTVDYNLWPEYSRLLVVIITFIGACAGSTGGGLKVSRIMILVKSANNEISRLLRPRSVRKVRLEGAPVEDSTVLCTQVFFFLYLTIVLLSALIISFDGFDFTTNFTAALTCVSNVGPGLSAVGPSGNFAAFSDLSKVVLTMNMLFGRLEIFPVLILFVPKLWKRA
ncbi:MAG: TrkH family potassium uptake protein [Oscillospiraceae bacterium]|nr:TrkH family potassium uptake protein [Oscillospiraceae bacterium]